LQPNVPNNNKKPKKNNQIKHLKKSRSSKHHIMVRGGGGGGPIGHHRSQNDNKDLLMSMWRLAAENAMSKYTQVSTPFMTQLATERNNGKNTGQNQRRQVVDHMRANERCVMKEFDNAFYDLLSNMELLITDCTRNSTLEDLY
jgi:hypothetical protein